MTSRRERLLQSAERLVARGRLDAAIEELHEVLKAQPDDTRTLNRIGDLYARLGRVEEAVELFERAAKHFSDEGFFVKGIAIYKKILRLEPTRLDVHEQLAWLHESQGLTNEARNQYRLLIDHYARLGNAERVVAGYERLVQLDPGDAAIRLRLADHLAAAGNTERAVEQYRKIASQMLERGRVDDALVVFTKALDQSPQDLGLVREVLLELTGSGRSDAAQRFVQIAADRNPEATELASLVAAAAADAREEPAVAADVPSPEPVAGAEPEEPEASEEPAELAAGEPEPPSDGLPAEFEIELESFEAAAEVSEGAAPERQPAPGSPAAEPVSETPAEAPVSEPAAEAPARTADLDPVAELLAEADALAGYGLEDRALERLRQALELEPRRLRIHQRLLALELADGDTERVLASALRAARFAEEVGDEAGWGAIGELLAGAGYRVDGYEVRPPEQPAAAPEPEEEPAEPGVPAEPTIESAPSAGEPPAAPDVSWLDSVDQPTGTDAAPSLDSEEDFFDLAGEIEEELRVEQGQLGEDLGSAMDGQSLEEIVAGFKKGMAETLSPDAYETHYDLGIAYREMGLVDEAISEFQLAAQDPRYLVDCCSLLGDCFHEKGFADLAIKWYKRGLDSPHIAGEQTLGLLYALGKLHLELGNADAARDAFSEISVSDPNFRDVAARLEELQD